MFRSMAATSTTSDGVGISVTRAGISPRVRASPSPSRSRNLLVLSPPRRDDAKASHFAVQVAPFYAEHFGSPRNVALLGGKRAKNVVALELVPCRVQRQRLHRLGGYLRFRWQALIQERQIAR